MSSVLSLASAVISIIGQIARNPALAGTKVEKYGELIGDLTDTASSLLARGEEGVAELTKFKTELKQLRTDLASGAATSENVVERIRTMRGRSDAAHDTLQKLKPAAGVPAGTEPAPLPPAGDSGGGATASSTVVDTGGGQRTVKS